ncbi:hypothetical protein TRFO_23685 [Tritrichomonas foetus]|uniref:Uncharacterized protein n=1 Tax=Tritrichomonas foetus TaxID=1144522 RepID=A0A1J4K9A0_9EUKA|nr:hypothetical protein TRFO_23685 [Tritrichomonas foetus]|eukprot:OHT07983.1 hypothetical protein TRFO_23685 [Tritrichomonas foetus]
MEKVTTKTLTVTFNKEVYKIDDVPVPITAKKFLSYFMKIGDTPTNTKLILYLKGKQLMENDLIGLDDDEITILQKKQIMFSPFELILKLCFYIPVLLYFFTQKLSTLLYSAIIVILVSHVIISKRMLLKDYLNEHIMKYFKASKTSQFVSSISEIGRLFISSMKPSFRLEMLLMDP